MQESIRNIIYKIDVGIEELILIFLIILNIFDFLELLPGELDYIKKIISWTLLGYLMYKANLTRIFFGTRQKLLNFIIIITYFFLVFKNFIAYTLATYGEVVESGVSSFLFPLYNFFAANNGAMANLFEHYSFYVGGILLLILSIYLALRMEIKAPSVMHVVHEEGNPPRNIPKLLVRFIVIFMVLTAFFVIVFNLVMEWLAIAVDAPIIILGLFFYFFVLVKHSRKLSPDSLIFRIGNFGESFYTRFINLFYSEKTIFLGITGMLVLHLLTEIGNFILPYVTTLHDPLYFSQFQASTHQHLIQHFLRDIVTLNIPGTIYVYLLNIIAIILLLVSPAFIWYVLYRQKDFEISKSVLALFCTGITVFLMAPLFKIKKLMIPNLVGADIITQGIGSANLLIPVLVSAAVGILVFALSSLKLIKGILIYLAVVVVQVFFAVYVYHFFVSATSYYISSIIALFQHSEILIAVYMLVFFAMTIVFYVVGFLVFVYLTWKS